MDLDTYWAPKAPPKKYPFYAPPPGLPGQRAPTETYSGRYGIMNERALWNSQNLGVVLLVNFFRAPINLGVVLLFFKNLQ